MYDKHTNLKANMGRVGGGLVGNWSNFHRPSLNRNYWPASCISASNPFKGLLYLFITNMIIKIKTLFICCPHQERDKKCVLAKIIWAQLDYVHQTWKKINAAGNQNLTLSFLWNFPFILGFIWHFHSGF